MRVLLYVNAFSNIYMHTTTCLIYIIAPCYCRQKEMERLGLQPPAPPLVPVPPSQPDLATSTKERRRLELSERIQQAQANMSQLLM